MANREYDFFRDRDVLHFAPEVSIRELVLNNKPRSYTTADLFAKGVDRKENIEALTIKDGSYDVVICLHVLEHVNDRKAMSELFRVLRPGGLLVLAHSDWDTALFASADDALTRLLVDRFVSTVPRWAERADGFMGRKLLGLAITSPFELVTATTWADPHRRFDKGSVGWKVAMGVLAATKDDPELATKAAAWVEGLGSMATEGRFLFAVTDVALVLRRPE